MQGFESSPHAGVIPRDPKGSVVIEDSATRHIGFPGVAKLADGRLLVAYGDAAYDGASDGSVVTRYSSDDGLTWGAAVVIASYTSGVSIGPAGVHVDELGVIRITCQLLTSPRSVAVLTSWDAGASWSLITVATSLATLAATSAPVISWGGTLLMPVYGTVGAETQRRAIIVRSDDGGLTWGDESIIALPVADLSWAEPNLIQSGADLICLLREQTHLANTYVARSTDAGRTWTGPGIAFPSVGGAPRLCRLSSGALVTTYRGMKGPTGRNVYRNSWDGGRTWQAETVLETTGVYSDYADQCAIANGLAIVVYGRRLSDTQGSIRATYLYDGYGGETPLGTTHPYPVVPSVPIRDWIEAWVTTPAGIRLATLDRSDGYPYRALAFSWERAAAGACSLQYAVESDVDPSVFAKGNLLWMSYRGQTRVYVSRGTSAELTRDEHGADWATVTGVGVKKLLRRRVIYPSSFDPSTADGRTPAKWPRAWASTLDGAAASGQKVVPVKSTTGAAAGMPVELVSKDATELCEIASVQAGVSITLKDDLEHAFKAGDRGYDATKQWRRFVNRAAGEMLWDLISESNARFVADGDIAITRGTVESTGSDGWTQDFSFHCLTDVVEAVEAAFGDVDITGDPETGALVFNYYADQGADVSTTIIFEEGKDVAAVEVDGAAGPDDEVPTVVIGIPEGEGVTRTTLAYASSGTAPRVEATIDLRDVKSAAQAQAETTAALANLARVNGTSVGVEVTEDRYQAFVDFGPGDDVRVVAPSRGVDLVEQIVAMYVGEEGDRVTVKVDVGAPRTAADLKARARQKELARSTGVTLNSQRGQLVPLSIADTVYFDTATASITGIYVSDRIRRVVECQLAIDFDQYPMPVSAATSGGGSTSGSTTVGKTLEKPGSESHPHSVTGTSGPASTGTAHTHSVGTYAAASGDIPVLPITNFTLDPHTHTTPDHTHSLTAGATKETYPASHSVTLKVYVLDGGSWTQVGSTITGITDDAPDIDLSSYITGPGRWRIVLQSAAAQPNGGRLGAHLSGYLWGVVESA